MSMRIWLRHAHTHTFEECVAERQVEVAHVKQRIHLGTFVVVLAVAPHWVALFSRECNHQSCQDPSLLTSLRLTPVTPPVSTCSSTTRHPTSAATAADSLFAATASYAIRNAIENRISFAFCLWPVRNIFLSPAVMAWEMPRNQKQRKKERKWEKERQREWAWQQYHFLAIQLNAELHEIHFAIQARESCHSQRQRQRRAVNKVSPALHLEAAHPKSKKEALCKVIH